MTNQIPKPEPRPRRAPRPIARRVRPKRSAPPRPAKASAWRTSKVARRPRAKLPKGAFADRRKLIARATDLWRTLIRAKAPDGLCVRCRVRPWHDAMHGFAKGPHPGALRFELDNGLPGCRSCHRRIDSDHHAKLELWLRVIGPERYRRLELMAQTRTKMDLQLTVLFLEGEVAKLKAAGRA